MLLTASLCPPVSETLLFLWYDKLWHSAAILAFYSLDASSTPVSYNHHKYLQTMSPGGQLRTIALEGYCP